MAPDPHKVGSPLLHISKGMKIEHHYQQFENNNTLKSGSISPSISNQQNSLLAFEAVYKAISFYSRYQEGKTNSAV